MRMWSKWTRRFSTKQQPRSTIRPRFEELEHRVVPTVASIVQSAASIVHDMDDIRSDVAAVATQLATNTSTAVQTDLSELKSGLTTAVDDLSAGMNVTSDLQTLRMIENTLMSDLGHSISPSIINHVRDLRRDTRDVVADTIRSGKDVRRGFQDFQADVTELATKLATNTSPKVVSNLGTIKSDLATVAADLAAGGSAAKDLKAVVLDLKHLQTNLGTSANDTIRDNLTDLLHDGRDLHKDLIDVGRALHRNITDVASDGAAIATALAPNTNPTVQADMAKLGTDLTTLSGDVTGGKPAAADLTKAIADVNTLVTDLGTTSQPLTHQLREFGDDLLHLAIVLAEGHVS
jgi:hypothetical protein